MAALMYNTTVMEALGIMGEDRPIVQLKKGNALYASFEDRAIVGIDGMKRAYPSWLFYGSARVRGGQYELGQIDGRRLFVGVSDPDPAEDVWSGMFAMTPNDDASLHHVTIGVQAEPEIAMRPSNYMNLGIYVQTDTITDRINYVACTVDILPDSLILRAESGLGNVTAVAGPYWAARLDISGLRQPYSGRLIAHGDAQNAVPEKKDFAGGGIYSYGNIDWMEKSKYYDAIHKGGRIKVLKSILF